MAETLRLHILGSGSATPTSARYPSAQALYASGRYFLIDCAEGTQRQIRCNHISFDKIGHVFISHLHGDHFFGLIGLISSMMLMGRTAELHIFAHADLQRYTGHQLDILAMNDLGFPLIFHSLNPQQPELIFEDKKMRIISFPLKHRIACCGFRFDEKPRLPNLHPEQLRAFAVPVSAMKSLKAGNDFITPNGEIIPNGIFTIPPPRPRSYAYCSDTAFSEAVVDAVHGVSVLYHEATFSKTDRLAATETFHSTAVDAAECARRANAEKLLLGHFSSRYKSTDGLLAEAREIFPETYAVNDNDIYDIDHIKCHETDR
ncbi:MAG: ribonuclease Z [Bacteroidales bacterium]|jgi:ribonuclease Z|nr:ribonuclease Z [Bacteroidales bacterium]